MADIDETLRHDLRDPEFSEGYADSYLDTYVATQLKVLREQRNLTQKQAAEASTLAKASFHDLKMLTMHRGMCAR